MPMLSVTIRRIASSTSGEVRIVHHLYEELGSPLEVPACRRSPALDSEGLGMSSGRPHVAIENPPAPAILPRGTFPTSSRLFFV